MNEKEKMGLGLPYQGMSIELVNERIKLKSTLFEFNNLNPAEVEKRHDIIRNILGKTGKEVYMEQPFRCDYGYNICLGEKFYSNYNLTILDCARVTIGDNCMLAPNVSIFTAGHPIHPDARNSGYEYALSVTIGNNVWIGGNSVVNPGVTIGDNVVIGSGSVVTKDIPSNVIAVGNPCTVIREVTEDDRQYYYKDRLFKDCDLII